MTPAMHAVLETGKWVLAVLFGVYLARQCRKPSGPVGWLITRLMNRSHAGLTSWAFGHITIAPNATILDVGCGGGRTIERLASHSPQGKVYGVDYASASVAATRRHNAPLIAQGRVEVRRGSVSALPFPDDTFDVVTAFETHYYWPDLVHDLGEIRRVLVPGGRLMIVAESYDRGGASAIQKPAMALLRAKFLTRDEHCRLFEAAGFAGVEAFEERSKGWLGVAGTKP